MSRELREFEAAQTQSGDTKPLVRRKRKKVRRKRSLWSQIKGGIIWGISIANAIIAIISALIVSKL